jgi:predicted phosphate transport protein (TIGR00153 family)
VKHLKISGGKLLEELHSALVNHAELVGKSVELLRKILVNYNEIGVRELSELYTNLSDIENKADSLKREIFNLVKISKIHPEDKEDFLSLVFYTEEIAGLSKAIAKKLLIFKHLGISIPASLHGYLSEMLSKSENASVNVVKLVKMYWESGESGFELAALIEKFEKEVDELRLKALEETYRICSSEYSVICIAIPIMIDDVESITDKCESVADIYRLHVVSRGLMG